MRLPIALTTGWLAAICDAFAGMALFSLFGIPGGALLAICLHALAVWVALIGATRARGGRLRTAERDCVVLAALFLAGSTDFLLTAPRHAARALAEAAGLALYPAPFDIPPYVLRLYSHVQHVGRDAHTWMIGQLKGLDISRTG